MLIPIPRLNDLSKQILETSMAVPYTDTELLIVITFLLDKLLARDLPLRAVVGSIINTRDEELRARFLTDLIAMCGESSSIH